MLGSIDHLPIRFLVLGRLEVMRLDLSEPHAVISIREPGSDLPLIAENDLCRGVLRLSFHDLDQPKGPESELFTPVHAREILAFVDLVRRDIEALVIHCEAGISRSAGVAAALSRAFFGEDRYFFDHYIPNRLVYSTLLRVWHETQLASS